MTGQHDPLVTRRAQPQEKRQTHGPADPANDPMAQVIGPDPASTSGRGVRIIGYSPTAAMVITVIASEDEGTAQFGDGAAPGLAQRINGVIAIGRQPEV